MFRIGVDLGGTNIAVGLVNENHEIVQKTSTPTLAKRSSEEIVCDIARLCKKVVADAGTDMSCVTSIGVASPGLVNSSTGVVEYVNNLPFKNLNVVAMLKDLLAFDNIKIANDANAAALGEATAGAAKGTSSSVMITLGTGVGGGVVIDGKLLTGFNFAAGELGHIVIEVGGRPCTCGRHGCWETYSSATALTASRRPLKAISAKMWAN